MNLSLQSSVISKTSLIAAAALTSALCAACSDTPQWTQQRRLAMGTWVDTTWRTPDAAAAERIDAEIDRMLRRYETDYYAWADGELGRLNRALAEGTTFTASAELANLLAHARTLSDLSDGLFDPGVGALVEAWGFHASYTEPQQPTAQFLAAWNERHPSIRDLELDGTVLRSTADRSDIDLIVDLGGIAKGEVVDRILARLAAFGIDDALVDAGGDVRVLGSRGERSWTVGIQSPRADALLGAIELHPGEAVFTSGDYERFFDSEAGRSHHLLDPASGRPATHTQAVTVIADNGALADAAATAIFIAGPARWRGVAAALGIALVLRVDADGTLEMTAAMRERLRMQDKVETATIPDSP